MTSKQISDEQLAFYYYNDGLHAKERQAISNALAIDPDLGERYRQLSTDLIMLDDIGEAQPPTDMVERWHETIRRSAARSEVANTQSRFHSWSFLWGVAVTAALAIGIGIGTFYSSSPTMQTPTQTYTASDENEQTAFVRSLRVHLQESEADLINLTVQSPASKADLVIEIIEQTRLFERAAVQNNEHGVARVLRAFELVLIRIAAEDTSSEDAEALREKLLFELNIMLTKLSQDTSEAQQTI